MKKVIKNPDGSTETIEGTADEIAEYERKLRESPKTKGKKPVLHGAEVDGQPLTSDEIVTVRLKRMGMLPKEKEYVYVPWWSPTPQPCRFCGVIGCNQLHIWCGTTINAEPNLQLTGNTVELGGNLNIGASLTCSDIKTSAGSWFSDYSTGCMECGSDSHSYCARD